MENQTFEMQFNEFVINYKLYEVKEAINFWLDFKQYNNELLLFIPSSNQRKDGPPIRTYNTENKLLNMIMDFDEKKNKYSSISKSILSLSKEELEIFDQIYIHHNMQIPFATKEDLFIKIASSLEFYEYKNEISSMYSTMKDAYFSRIKSEIELRRKDFNSLLIRYEQFILPEWKKKNWYQGNGDLSRNKQMFILATLYIEKIISYTHMSQLVNTFHGHKKFLKHMQSCL